MLSERKKDIQSSNEQLQVTSQYLRQKEQEMLSLLEKIRQSIAEITGQLQGIDQSFDFGGMSSMQKTFYTEKEILETSCQELKCHMEKLSEIARIYEEAEEKNKNVTGSN